MRAVQTAAPSTTRLLCAAALGAAVAVPALVIAAHRADSAAHFCLVAGFALLLIALAACDFATLLLPNVLMYPGLVAALALCWAWPDRGALASLAGGLVGGGAMLLAYLLLPGFGAGDVKLCALIGLVVGLRGVGVALTLGVLLTGAVALAGLATRRLSLRSALPFGPGLAAGALLVLLRLYG